MVLELHTPQRTLVWLEGCGMMGWLLKDLGWVILSWPLAWPAAATALASETARMWVSWGQDSVGVRVHSFAAFLWLLGNCIWMTAELLFDEDTAPGRAFPWFAGSLAGSSASSYDIGLKAFFYCEGAALVMLGMFYIKSLLDHMSTESSRTVGLERKLIFGVVTPEVYDWIFIGPWILKDIFWACSALAPALVAGAAVCVIVIHNFFRSDCQPLLFAELLWVGANIVWILGELHFQDQVLWPRIAAAAMLLTGCAITGLSTMARHRDEKSAKETQPLLGQVTHKP